MFTLVSKRNVREVDPASPAQNQPLAQLFGQQGLKLIVQIGRMKKQTNKGLDFFEALEVSKKTQKRK